MWSQFLRNGRLPSGRSPASSPAWRRQNSAQSGDIPVWSVSPLASPPFTLAPENSSLRRLTNRNRLLLSVTQFAARPRQQRAESGAMDLIRLSLRNGFCDY